MFPATPWPCVHVLKPPFTSHVPLLTHPNQIEQSCGGLVKPDIVFFGESLPERFWER